MCLHEFTITFDRWFSQRKLGNWNDFVMNESGFARIVCFNQNLFEHIWRVTPCQNECITWHETLQWISSFNHMKSHSNWTSMQNSQSIYTNDGGQVNTKKRFVGWAASEATGTNAYECNIKCKTIYKTSTRYASAIHFLKEERMKCSLARTLSIRISQLKVNRTNSANSNVLWNGSKWERTVFLFHFTWTWLMKYSLAQALNKNPIHNYRSNVVYQNKKKTLLYWRLWRKGERDYR